MISLLLILLVIGCGMALIHAYISGPAKMILLVACGVAVLLVILAAAGVLEAGALRLR